MHPYINTAIQAARKAGNIIVRHLDKMEQVSIQTKGRNDFVSSVDKLAESEIIYTIQQTYPDHQIIAEESGKKGEHEVAWIIDPLDGTTNYLHGFPQFAVSIGVRDNGVMKHAVIYDPLRDELFVASKGRGARMNDIRIRVSNTNTIKNALIGTGFPYTNIQDIDPYLANLKHIMSNCHGIRRAGSAALDLAYVACGRLDGFWESGLKIWDISAGGLLIQEAGGLVSDFKGENNFHQNGEIIAANPKVFIDLSKILRTKK